MGYLQFWTRSLSPIFGDILGMYEDYFKMFSEFLYVCQSISCFISLLNIFISPVLDKTYFYFFHSSQDVFKLVPIDFHFLYVCQSVCLLTSILKKSLPPLYVLLVMIYTSEFSGGIPLMFVNCFPIIIIF